MIIVLFPGLLGHYSPIPSSMDFCRKVKCPIKGGVGRNYFHSFHRYIKYITHIPQVENQK